MSAEDVVFSCNVAPKDYLEVEEAFDDLGLIGFEFKGPNIENNTSRIITLDRKQAKALIALLQKAVGDYDS